MATRGYAAWKPKPEAAHWVLAVRDVCDEYRDYWPLSVRQIFYRVVADHGYPKSEAAYNKLTGIISRARRAQMLPWPAIRDGGLGRSVPAHFYDDAQDFAETIKSAAGQMKLNRQDGQEKVIELWCEAGGMVPILQGIAEPYSCTVNTGGGYDSVTAKHNLAVRVRDRAREGKKTLILHVGDFDGSGEDMCDVLRDDTRHMVVSQIARAAAQNGWEGLPTFVREWRAGEDRHTSAVTSWALSYFEVERVALTAEQVVERGVETAPPKPTDSRSVAFAERNAWVAEELGTEHITAQLEALTPPELDELISGAIAAQMDMEVFAEVTAREEEVREELLERLGDI